MWGTKLRSNRHIVKIFAMTTEKGVFSGGFRLAVERRKQGGKESLRIPRGRGKGGKQGRIVSSSGKGNINLKGFEAKKKTA